MDQLIECICGKCGKSAPRISGKEVVRAPEHALGSLSFADMERVFICGNCVAEHERTFCEALERAGFSRVS